jgi:hypothetical protein
MKTKDRRKSKNVVDVRGVPMGKQVMANKHMIDGEQMPFQHGLKYPDKYNDWVDPENDSWRDKPVKNVKAKNTTPKKANAGASVKPDRQRKK